VGPIRRGDEICDEQCLLLAYSVEKLCFEKNNDFICDLRPFIYSRYEGVVDSL
jgi:hypothetical protein